MSRATPQMRKLAKQLMVYEGQLDKSARSNGPAAFQVTDKMRPHLATLMGIGGFRALHLRALALASAEVSWLRAVRVKADGSLEGLEALHAQLDPADFLEGRVVLLAQLLGLLVVFIGSNLTMGLVREIWPKISLDDIDFGEEEKHEKAK